MRFMVYIERKDDYGNVVVKKFKRLKDAFNWLSDSSVKQNIEQGFVYRFLDKSVDEEDSSGG